MNKDAVLDSVLKMMKDEEQRLMNLANNGELSWDYVAGFHNAMRCVKARRLGFETMEEMDRFEIECSKLREKMAKDGVHIDFSI